MRFVEELFRGCDIVFRVYMYTLEKFKVLNMFKIVVGKIFK